MYRIGLSGGIASGKSTVVSMLKEYGAAVIDCDELAKEVVQPGSEGLDAVCRSFGPQALLPDGTMDRRYIGSIVFNQPERKRELEKIIHPLIWRRIDEEISSLAENEKKQFVFLDMPLLFELKYYLSVDEVWLVYVDPATQLVRLMARNGFTKDEALARIKAQLPIEKKKALAHVVIDNTGTLGATAAQVQEQWQALLARISQ
jgi:dephospho-CoA kinase